MAHVVEEGIVAADGLKIGAFVSITRCVPEFDIKESLIRQEGIRFCQFFLGLESELDQDILSVPTSRLNACKPVGFVLQRTYNDVAKFDPADNPGIELII